MYHNEKLETPKIAEVFAQCSMMFIGPARAKQDTQLGEMEMEEERGRIMRDL